ncbi:MAG TPA: helix-turn-helix domain-containing protein [Nocardioides sp.]|uniref:helix-turn-helix domain-containing protein n=1 Tax=Nocardioides sp. TaxID=35761 RepID=UPI002E362B80|nr:helix-turn-helix domain-containing protein [Nocardioides sp.]HEX3929842.1 helix-turn-helix domain-containing protein [Nocardioides sp.]
MSTTKGARDDLATQGPGEAAGEAAGASPRDPRQGDAAAAGPSYRRLSDPRELQALAHPVRLGIMELLTVDGPLTATELADRLDESPANCSWHLRKLAEHAFVEEAGGGIGRQRPWQVRQMGLAWDDVEASPGERRAGRALSEMLLQRQVARYLQARSQLLDDGDVDWADAATSSEHASWLTADELDALNLEIRAVLERYAARLTDPAQRPSGSRLCELVAWGAPLLLPGLEATP